MRCPGCHRNAIPVRAKLGLALRANIACPACGAAIRFGFWPRTAHVVTGVGVLGAGLASALNLGQPTPLVLAGAFWLGFALVLPPSTDSHAAPRVDPERLDPPAS